MTNYLRIMLAAYDNRALFGDRLCSQVIACSVTRDYCNMVEHVETFVDWASPAYGAEDDGLAAIEDATEQYLNDRNGYVIRWEV
jgi:hypothetical protein